MALQLYNTITRSVEPFVPLDPEGRRVGLYCCGPTVYDFGHIGNFRTFVFADLVRRYLEFKGYAVTAVMNITDVEDKIIARIRTTGTALREYTTRYETAFFEDARALNLLPPHHCPRATEHIDDIIALIAKLAERGFAYQAADGSVYFSIEKYRAAGGRYGRLVNLNFDEMRIGERVKSDEYAKDAMADFALWKARTPEDGAVTWASPWGEGRPGWHIECSAMSMKILGPSFDLHLGGEDLAFPHHEDEIAQSEGAGVQTGGQPFVKHWLHGAHLLVEGRKMSKSLGNFFTLRDLLSRGFAGREIRYLLLTAHYRESFNFTLGGLQGARAALARLDECLAKLREVAGAIRAEPDVELVRGFEVALDDDLNVSAAWAAVFEWIRQMNRAATDNELSPARAAAALAAWSRLDTVLGIGERPDAEAPPEIVALLEARQQARKAREFQRADAIRGELKARGWLVEDTPKGPRLKRDTRAEV
ncbi:MAG: cysteine--tRNA ligase [Verrucomicrobia bacterium]|jgi:cysteinyl-tRNA synthetase|nr:cysteine--tRNA ligase [Verrucomicrobiota bacterium]OQC62667.1 MAG: Cysteine--tRNA ligase [Verrucomicrobia bacterium ADurb.Bin006]NMD18870.1 cysteine--tRNA ligase [Verrucomicrobiota bacterium]HOA61788.1 cysteine--tRNA ligase [Verrucomicrobiota bacterium]HOF46750.1 cysteine--tRNA ligase [Verrucomicrobiota bacterium]